MPAAVSPRLAGNFKTVMALSSGSGSGSSASSRALCFRISTRSVEGELLIMVSAASLRHLQGFGRTNLRSEGRPRKYRDSHNEETQVGGIAA